MTPVFSIILAITLAISAFLIFELIYNLRRQKKAERLLSAFEKTAAEFGLSISKRDITGNRVIGFDDINNKLLFVQLTGNKEDGYLIDLEEVSSARVSRTYTPFWNGWTKSGSLVQTIGLQIEYKNGARPLLLPFYATTGAHWATRKGSDRKRLQYKSRQAFCISNSPCKNFKQYKRPVKISD